LYRRRQAHRRPKQGPGAGDVAGGRQPNRSSSPIAGCAPAESSIEFDPPIAIVFWTEPGLVTHQRDFIDWDEC
jgi:hypothetical protein